MNAFKCLFSAPRGFSFDHYGKCVIPSYTIVLEKKIIEMTGKSLLLAKVKRNRYWGHLINDIHDKRLKFPINEMYHGMKLWM
jgi:hypothetical protein